MAKNASFGSLIAVALDPEAATPVYRQLYAQMRGAIISGRLATRMRLPSSRVLAAELGVSRNTVMTALDQLTTEGYLVGRVGDGTYVASVLPEDRFLPRTPLPQRDAAGAGAYPALSARGRLLTDLSVTAGPAQPIPFVADLPAFDAFPLDAWARLMVQSWRAVEPAMLGYADPAGYAPLRALIAAHLQAARFLACSPAEVIMTSGSQQSLDLLARVLIDQGDAVWIEEPGYTGARSAFIAAGARLVPVPVDADGLKVEQGARLEPAPKLIFVSPSRQYPLGVTMSVARRQELLAFAGRTGAWIIEDDYDSEFRYRGAPLPAVQSIDRAARVIYLGTFSKSLLPSFRLGYMVVPSRLSTAFANAKAVIDRHPPLLEQITLAAFIKSGQFAAHIRRMRQVYQERQEILLAELERTLAGFLRASPADTGMHLIADLPDGIDDRDFCRAAAAHGISLRPLSIYYQTEPRRHGLILGFAAIPPKRIRWGVERLATVVGEVT